MSLNPYEVPSGQSNLNRNGNTSHRTRLSAVGGFIGFASLGLALSFAIWTASVSSGVSFFMVAVVVWVAAPFMFLWLASIRVKTFAGRAMLAAVLVATAAFGVWAFDTVDEDAQGALALLFGPAYQLAGVLVALMVLAVIEWIARRTRSRSTTGTEHFVR